MQKHTKIYFNHFGYGIDDIILCENCGNRAVDIHHIKPKKMGGGKNKDHIENLIALCRQCHVDAHSNKISEEVLIQIHFKNLNN